MSETSDRRLAIPLTRGGPGSFVEASVSLEADDDLTLSDGFAHYLSAHYQREEAEVDLGGARYRAFVLTPLSGEGLAYVITDTHRKPIDTSSALRDTGAQVSVTGSYRKHLEEIVSFGESPSPGETYFLWSSFIRPNFDLAKAETEPEDTRISWERVKRFGRLVILGEPGSGKTSCLRRLALESIDADTNLIPLYIQLRNDSSSGLAPGQIGERHDANSPARALVDVAQSGSLMLLLDGLDEAPPEHRDELVDSLITFTKRYPRTRVVISTRSAGYGRPLEGFVHVRIRPFSDAQVVEWTMLNVANRELGERFLTSAWARTETRELLRRPLLLVIAVSTYRRYGSLPSRTADLYGKFVRTLLDDWDRVRAVERSRSVPAPEVTVRVLAELCYELVRSQRSQFSQDDFARWLSSGHRGLVELGALEDCSGLIRQTQADRYVFLHNTIRDYLAAEHAVRMTRDIAGEFSRLAEEPSWRRVWSMGCQLASDASPLVVETMRSHANSPVVARLVANAIREGAWLEDRVHEEACEFIARVLEQEVSILDVLEPGKAVDAEAATLILVANNTASAKGRLVDVAELLGAIHGAIHCGEQGEALRRALTASPSASLHRMASFLAINGLFAYTTDPADDRQLILTIRSAISSALSVDEATLSSS